MGMAAGQARLLSITARLSDNEQKGQSLSFAKQRLADEADQINREYNEALNATKLTVLTGFNGSEPVYTDISYGLLTEYNKLASGKQYLVTNQRGKILVTDEIAKAYKAGNGDFNVFINKFGITQTDVDFTIDPALTQEKKDAKQAENYQLVHDAWDKYLTSVGLHFPEMEHDYSNPLVEFGWNPDISGMDADGNVTPNVGAPYYTINKVYAENVIYGTFTNDDGNGNALFDDLPVGSIYTVSTPYMNAENSLKENGLCFEAKASDGATYRYMIERTAGDDNAVGRIWLNKYDSNGNKYSANIGTIEYKDADTQNWIDAKNIEPEGIISNLHVSDGYTSFVANINDYTLKNQHIPLNYEGTTKEQRELYDYAVALTRSYANADYYGPDTDSDGVPDLKYKSVEDNPENAAKIQYYRNIFNEMQQFGFVTEADMKINMNVSKLGMKDNNWFEQQLRQGKLLLKTYDSSKGKFVNTTYAEDSNIQEVEDDRRIAKAEIDYTQAQEALERKDKKIDLNLKQLDTEHNALQTEYESVKSVVDKNIEKSFNIFS